MPYNWEITVSTPVLTVGMSFQVRYRELPGGAWLPLVPNPTTQTFTIPDITDGVWEVEVRTQCANGSLSNPVYHQRSFGTTSCVPAAADPLYALPDAVQGTPYVATIPLVGSQPFTMLAISNIPSWMNLAIDGDHINVTGTPDVPGINFPVEFTISNPCNPSLSFTYAVNVDAAAGVQLVLIINGDGMLEAQFYNAGAGPYSFEFSAEIMSGACSFVNLNDPSVPTQPADNATCGFTYGQYSGSSYRFRCEGTYDDGFGAGIQINSNYVNLSACLVPETMILLHDGTETELRNIVEGDVLHGSNKVLQVDRMKADRLFVINDGRLKTSEGHINILSNGDLRRSDALKEGDMLPDLKGLLVRVDKIEIQHGEFDVINIATETQDYIANGILTHNKLPC